MFWLCSKLLDLSDWTRAGICNVVWQLPCEGMMSKYCKHVSGVSTSLEIYLFNPLWSPQQLVPKHSAQRDARIHSPLMLLPTSHSPNLEAPVLPTLLSLLIVMKLDNTLPKKMISDRTLYECNFYFLFPCFRIWHLSWADRHLTIKRAISNSSCPLPSSKSKRVPPLRHVYTAIHLVDSGVKPYITMTIKQFW
jgi:hypothetical protein